MKFVINQIMMDDCLVLSNQGAVIVNHPSTMIEQIKNLTPFFRSFSQHPFPKPKEGEHFTLAPEPSGLAATINTQLIIRLEIFDFKDDFSEIFTWLSLTDPPPSVQFQMKFQLENGSKIVQSIAVQGNTIFEAQTTTSYITNTNKNQYSCNPPIAWSKLVATMNLIGRNILCIDDQTTSLEWLKKRIREENLIERISNKDTVLNAIKKTNDILPKILGKSVAIDMGPVKAGNLFYNYANDALLDLFKENSLDALIILLLVHAQLRSKTTSPLSVLMINNIEEIMPEKSFLSLYPYLKAQTIQMIGMSNSVPILKMAVEQAIPLVK